MVPCAGSMCRGIGAGERGLAGKAGAERDVMQRAVCLGNQSFGLGHAQGHVMGLRRPANRGLELQLQRAGLRPNRCAMVAMGTGASSVVSISAWARAVIWLCWVRWGCRICGCDGAETVSVIKLPATLRAKAGLHVSAISASIMSSVGAAPPAVQNLPLT